MASCYRWAAAHGNSGVSNVFTYCYLPLISTAYLVKLRFTLFYHLEPQCSFTSCLGAPRTACALRLECCSETKQVTWSGPSPPSSALIGPNSRLQHPNFPTAPCFPQAQGNSMCHQCLLWEVLCHSASSAPPRHSSCTFPPPLPLRVEQTHSSLLTEFSLEYILLSAYVCSYCS